MLREQRAPRRTAPLMTATISTSSGSFSARLRFGSSAHFSAAFRQMFGLAPSELAKRRLEVIKPAPSLHD